MLNSFAQEAVTESLDVQEDVFGLEKFTYKEQADEKKNDVMNFPAHANTWTMGPVLKGFLLQCFYSTAQTWPRCLKVR